MRFNAENALESKEKSPGRAQMDKAEPDPSGSTRTARRERDWCAHRRRGGCKTDCVIAGSTGGKLREAGGFDREALQPASSEEHAVNRLIN